MPSICVVVRFVAMGSRLCESDTSNARHVERSGYLIRICMTVSCSNRL
jgi:hypothetical protein